MVQIYLDNWWVISGVLLNISFCFSLHSLFMQLLFTVNVFIHSVRIYQGPLFVPVTSVLSSVTAAHKWEKWSDKEITTYDIKSVLHFSTVQL